MDWISEFIKAIDNDMSYDFICNHYWEMPKDDLKNILCEYIYAIHNEGNESNVRDELMDLCGGEE